MKENKLLTKKDKENLYQILLHNRLEELNLNKLSDHVSGVLENKLLETIKDIFKDNIEILERYKNVSDNLRLNVSDYDVSVSRFQENLLNYPMIKGVISESNLVRGLEEDDHIGDLNEKEKYRELKLNGSYRVRVRYPRELPDISLLEKIASKLGYGEKINNIINDILSILSENEKKDLSNIASEISHIVFIQNNYLREYKYPKEGSSVYEYGEFLWNIKTWKHLQEFNLDWYNLLVDNTNEEENFDMSGKSVEEILNNLDKELGL